MMTQEDFFVSTHSDEHKLEPAPAAGKTKLGRKPSPSYAARAQQVSSDFLRPAMKRLDVTANGLADALGVTSTTVYSALKTGHCGKWLKVAVNGLMAEAAIPIGDHRDHLPTVVQESSPDTVPLVIHVPRDQVATARALIGSLGWEG